MVIRACRCTLDGNMDTMIHKHGHGRKVNRPDPRLLLRFTLALQVQIASLFRAWCVTLCCLSLSDLRQRSMIHHARNYDAYCVLVAGLVFRTVLPELGRAQATPHDSPGRKLAHISVIVSGVVTHIVLPELAQAQAAQYDTPDPKL